MHKNTLYKGRSTLVAMVTTAACSRPRASFSHKNVAKKIEILNDIQVEQCTFRGLRIAQIPMKEGAAFWTSAALSA